MSWQIVTANDSDSRAEGGVAAAARKCISQLRQMAICVRRSQITTLCLQSYLYLVVCICICNCNCNSYPLNLYINGKPKAFGCCPSAFEKCALHVSDFLISFRFRFCLQAEQVILYYIWPYSSLLGPANIPNCQGAKRQTLSGLSAFSGEMGCMEPSSSPLRTSISICQQRVQCAAKNLPK